MSILPRVYYHWYITIGILLIGMFLAGCAASTRIYRDEEGRVWKVESKGAVRTVVEEEGFKLEQDSKKEPFKLEIPLTKIGK